MTELIEEKSGDDYVMEAIIKQGVPVGFEEEIKVQVVTPTTVGEAQVIPGEGKPGSKIMMIHTAPQPEEIYINLKKGDSFYRRLPQPRKKFGRGPIGDMMTTAMKQGGIKPSEVYRTALVKHHVVDINLRKKPTRNMVDFYLPILLDEIRRVEPKLILCTSKFMFDLLLSHNEDGIRKVKATDAEGCWWTSDLLKIPGQEIKEPTLIDCSENPEEQEWVNDPLKSLKELEPIKDAASIKIYLLRDPAGLFNKPDLVGRYTLDFTEARRMLTLMRGGLKEVPVNYRLIKNERDLKEIVNLWQREKPKLFGVDCEWHKQNFANGILRSVQLSWAPGEAVFIQFYEPKKNKDGSLELRWCFETEENNVAGELVDMDLSFQQEQLYARVGKILGTYLDLKDVLYAGHFIHVDLPWLHKWLGLNWYNKTFMDTAFALQTCDESADLKLERLAMLTTTFGRYDFDLLRWRRKNSNLVKSGYGYVPTDILMPYACKDVDAVIRAVPFLVTRLVADETYVYYINTLNDFVGNVFTNFSLTGLPMDQDALLDLENLLAFTCDKLKSEFTDALVTQSIRLFTEALSELQVTCRQTDNKVALQALNSLQEILATTALDEQTVLSTVEESGHFQTLCEALSFEETEAIVVKYEHMLNSTHFKIRSSPQMRRWLFDVLGHEPLKTTNQKDKGLPSMAWSAVAKLTPERQKLYTPATDAQTLKILAEQDPLIAQLLRFNQVDNLRKQFVPRQDEDADFNTRRGLRKWVCGDGFIHGQWSLTETARPRSWNPNTLNWPGFLADSIKRTITEIIDKYADEIRENHPELLSFLEDKKIPFIRSCVKAPPGYCFVESDFQTAELRGLAYISGDANMIKLLTEKDPCFGYVKVDGYEEIIRISFDEELFLPKEYRDPGVLFKLMKKGEVKGEFTEADLLRDEDGNIIHPKYDLHWSLAELVHKKCREFLDSKLHRSGTGKVGNFSSIYGATANSMERNIETQTGETPPPGTGVAIIEALKLRQPVAFQFLEEQMANLPARVGEYRAASGRLRRFHTHDQEVVDDRTYHSVMSSQGREARNFPMQESVAATAALASSRLLDYYIEEGMEARPMVVLYDSVVTMCPYRERHKVAKAHQRFMCDELTWKYHGRELNYPIDTDIVMRWSDTNLPGNVKDFLNGDRDEPTVEEEQAIEAA